MKTKEKTPSLVRVFSTPKAKQDLQNEIDAELMKSFKSAVKAFDDTYKNPHAVALGKLGGKAGEPNKKKARSSKQARAAALSRWVTPEQLKSNWDPKKHGHA